MALNRTMRLRAFTIPMIPAGTPPNIIAIAPTIPISVYAKLKTVKTGSCPLPEVQHGNVHLFAVVDELLITFVALVKIVGTSLCNCLAALCLVNNKSLFI